MGIMKKGDILHVICSDSLSTIDIPHLVNQTGHELLKKELQENEYKFWILLR